MQNKFKLTSALGIHIYARHHTAILHYFSSAKSCKNGTREECPIEKCPFQHLKLAPLSSTARKTSFLPTSASPTLINGSSAKMCGYGTRDKCPIEKCRFQHAEPAPVQPVAKDCAPQPTQPVPNADTAIKSIPVGSSDMQNLSQGR